MKKGFTIGKFAPFHKGHEYLIQKGIDEMDEFYIVIYDTPQFNISVETKKNWIQCQFPNAKILYAFNSPKQYGLDEESVKIQMEYLSEIIKDIPVNHFYSSEEYGAYVAEYLDIKNVVVDPKREVFPISSSMVRKDTKGNKAFLNEEVYSDYVSGVVKRDVHV